MREYKIKFNGKQEAWIRSDEEMSFEKAQEWIKEKGRTPTTVSELWAIDSETKKPRWLLLKEASVKGFCWVGEDPEEFGKEDTYYAYNVHLHNGSVHLNYHNSNSYALCRVVGY